MHFARSKPQLVTTRLASSEKKYQEGSFKDPPIVFLALCPQVLCFDSPPMSNNPYSFVLRASEASFLLSQITI